ncbi:oxygen-independent coproporphyrinogen-III oxidase-like protein YqeR [Oxobacter pfennigii]|uniref:Oxygen-independent coproporphyrinogen-III oxidase-like protein YqeR n=1 Tax=Oxobacter pfennigii TaxID=36849 RepID=A0A0P8YW62_9CLOT|nr:radical SAM protein [Oxobacter pfennigii]KPU43941.1 oxygen-independent coproporphyrinogen-III oxidase-like protein YqeR [Oxobacter pfennigii]
MKKHYIIPIFVPHKGCTHDCVFCNQKRITGQIGNVDNTFVEEEIKKYLNTIPRLDNYIEVSFFGGSFTGLPINEQIELLKPAKAALDNSFIDAIRLSTRPDYINEEILKILKEYGVSIIELGVQSLDNDVLQLSNRGHSREDVYKSSALIKEWGFRLGLQMMIGLPGDSEKKDIQTAKEFVKINPEMVRIYPALVIKDTYMEDMYKEGIYTPLTLSEAVNISGKLYLIFEKADINIIRIGLQPTENITEGRDLVAGPFHPSFRELVESKLLNDMIRYMASNNAIKSFEIEVNEKMLSKVYAAKKLYFMNTVKALGMKEIKVKVKEDIPIGTIRLKSEEISQILSIKDYSLII